MRLQDCPAGPVLDKAVAEALGTAEVKPWSTDLITAWELAELHHIGVIPVESKGWWAAPDAEEADLGSYYEVEMGPEYFAETAPLAIARRFLLDKFYEAWRTKTSHPFLENARAYLLSEGVDPDADP